MNTNDIDIELFISEVKKRPELWDVNSRDFRYLKRKKRAWLDIAAVCITDFEKSTHSEKLTYRNLKEKWRNIRDSFVRAKRLKNTRYLYTKHLAFLNANYARNGSFDSEEATQTRSEGTPETEGDSGTMTTIKVEPDDSTDCSHPEFDGSSLDATSKKHGARKIGIEFIDTNPEYPDTSSVRRSEPEDEDRCFFDSLLSAVRHFDMDQKLEFRSEVLASIKRIRGKS